MNKPKFVMLELELDDLMHVIMKMAELLTEARKRPDILKMIPESPEQLVILAMEATVEMRKRHEAAQGSQQPQQPEPTSTPEQQAAALKAAAEALAKAQSESKS